MKYNREGLIELISDEFRHWCPGDYIAIDCADSGNCKDCFEQALEKLLVPSEEETK